jgi:DUF1009 family protein
MKLGLIAASGRLPFLVLNAARGAGWNVTVIALEHEASSDLDVAAARPAATSLHWVRLDDVARWVKILKSAGVTQAVMAGPVRYPPRLAACDAIPAVNIVAPSPARGDGLAASVAEVLAEHGIEMVNASDFLSPLLAGAGVLTGRPPTGEEQRDLAFGYQIADALAGLNIGQTIAVKSAAVVAVEAMDGTDQVIARAGQLAGANVRIIKVAKPNLPLRFAFPVVGVSTIAAMTSVAATVLSVDAGRTLIIDRDAVVRAANAAGITIVGRAQAGL